LLALLGGLPGLALAFLVTLLVRDQLANFVPGIALTPRIVLLGLVLMLGLGFATGLVPALNAFRLKIAVALGRG
jgi:putative ABC transport system permease protein